MLRLPDLDPSSIMDDCLVLAALPPGGLTPELLASHGARDIMLLPMHGPTFPTRHADHVLQRYVQLSDVRKDNCQVAILHGRTAHALTEKAKFGRFDHILVPFGFALFATMLGLLRYGWRGGLTNHPAVLAHLPKTE